MKKSAEPSTIDVQLMWDRLLAIVEDQAQTLIRTAFSTTVREAGDLSAGIFDTRGHMLAQAITGTPGHVNAMAASVGPYRLWSSASSFSKKRSWTTRERASPLQMT